MHKNTVACFMAVVMLFGIVLMPAASALAQEGDFTADDDSAPFQASTREVQTKPRVAGETDPASTEPARYTVLLAAPPLALYRGGIAGLAATSPDQTGGARLALDTDSSAAYTHYLESQQATALDAIAATIGRAPAVIFDYQVTLNGFTLEMTPQEAHQVVALEGVKIVERDGLYQLHSDAGPAWIGAPDIWDGSAIPVGPGTRGEGVVIGVLDTGINVDHTSFATVGGDGYINTNSRDKYYGVCDPESEVYLESFNCTEKLIGGWNFIDEGIGPFDAHGHGSHTASTAAGNRMPNAAVISSIYRYEMPISGVAPRANIIAYKVCHTYGCPYSATQAGIEQAAIDQVDVINYSIGGGAEHPWTNTTSLAFLAAIEAGVTIATSAGNSGPADSSVGSPANAPWAISVGASTHNRRLASSLIDLAGGDTAPPASMIGQGMSEGYGPAPIVYAGFMGDPYCYGYGFDPGSLTDEIVLCDWNNGSRVGKSFNVRSAGGKGLILANGITRRAVTHADPHVIPTVHISYLDGLRLKLWLATGAGHTATISGTTIDLQNANGDVMASFSSRGPNRPLPAVIKPDLTAPGVDVLAAYVGQDAFTFSNGTSMSSPHVAGAVALIKAIHPEWTPAEIKSALMMTAQPQGVRKEDGVTAGDPFDRGSGRVDLRGAARVGFVLDESILNFAAADPYAGGDPTTLNLPSLADPTCEAACSWVRVLKSTQDKPVTWTTDAESPDGLNISVEPSSFTLAASGVQTVTITANATVEALGHWAFGQVNFNPDASELVTAHLPVAVYALAGELADVNVQTRRNQGAFTIEDIVTIGVDDQVTSIYADTPEVEIVEIGYDASIASPYQDMESDGVIWTMRALTDTTRLFITTIVDSTSPRLDMYVGFDADGDGRPSAEEEICAPYWFGTDERCHLRAPLDAGDYWIMVHNLNDDSVGTDEFKLLALIVDESDTDHVTASGPTTVIGGEPFDLTLQWDIPDMKRGDEYIGVLEMGQSGTERVVLDAEFTLTRLDDDVSFGADSTLLWPGRSVTYAIEVEPEMAAPGDSTEYTFVATLPSGMNYTPGSASIPPTSITGNTIVWEDMEITKQNYMMSDSINDPQCDTPYGGYINLEEFGIFPRATISGDEFIIDMDDYYYRWESFNFFGVEYDELYFSANGFGTFDPDVGANAAVNSDLPDPAAPNNLIAPFWRDLEVVYEVFVDESGALTSVRGVTIAQWGAGDLLVIEFDDVEPAPAGSTDERYDFEIFLQHQPDDAPGAYEIVFAYENLNGSLTPATIGIENADGSVALKYAYNDAELANGLMVCYDWATPTTTITFQATVDESLATTMVDAAQLVTTLDHTVNVEGYLPARAEVAHELYTGPVRRLFLPLIEGQKLTR